MVLFLQSKNSFRYIPENESEQDILGWNMSPVMYATYTVLVWYIPPFCTIPGHLVYLKLCNPHYKPVMKCSYFTVLGIYNNCNIIYFCDKYTAIEYIYLFCRIAIDVISDNITYILKKIRYGSIINIYPITIGYYISKFSYDKVT